MKAVILAGGLGTRLSEETHLKPKPMVEIGGMPIIWHIMKSYLSHGIDDFIICCGYKGYVIKEYFANYSMHNSDITIDMENDEVKLHNKKNERWKITLIDTGAHTMTAGRLKRIEKLIEKEKEFCFTYGDGVSDINISELINFHRKHGKIATVTAVYPPARFGVMEISDNKVTSFKEKPKREGGFVNGGYFVLSPKVMKYISGDAEIWEQEPLIKLAKEGSLMAYRHTGFWQPMDTLHDKIQLDELYKLGKAPWKVWK